MGNTTLMMEHSRDAWVVRSVDELMRDLRYAFRAALTRSPGSRWSPASHARARHRRKTAAIFSLINATVFSAGCRYTILVDCSDVGRPCYSYPSLCGAPRPQRRAPTV